MGVVITEDCFRAKTELSSVGIGTGKSAAR